MGSPTSAIREILPFAFRRNLRTIQSVSRPVTFSNPGSDTTHRPDRISIQKFSTSTSPHASNFQPHNQTSLKHRRSVQTASMSQPKLTSSIGIVGGGGAVGSTIAYSLIMNPITGDVLLVDPNKDLVQAQIDDLSDVAHIGGHTATRVRVASHKEVGETCDIIILTAGAAQKQGESRTDLIGKNLKILKSAIDDCKPFRDDAILLIVANPVDILTEFAQRYAGLSKQQVFGAGTLLDSARLRGQLAERSGASPSSIDTFVLGEHGESQLVAWSHASIGGVALDDVVNLSPNDKKEIAETTKNMAGKIINTKGNTAFGIGGITASLCKSILFDQRNIRPVSFYQENLGCCLSMPAVIGRKGIVKAIPMKLNEEEQKALENSAKSLRSLVQEAENNE